MLTVYDEFAGWGGSSQGCTAVPGVTLALAANHASIAIDVHALNFPDADHYLGDVTKADIESFPRTDLFWSSPACPPFSNARGEKQYFDLATQAALFDDPDESPDEREKRLSLVKRRALMEEVPRYLRAMVDRGEPVLAGVVENVTQVRQWDEHDRWRREIESLGYESRMIAFNSMHARSRVTRRAPQSRDRYYLAYWLKALGRSPDWDKWLRPRAWCETCQEWVNAIQVFKDPTRDMGSYGIQYAYRCPRVSCRNRVVTPEVLPASAAIDWTIPPGERIGDRVKPLKDATLARIGAGLRKYSGEAARAGGLVVSTAKRAALTSPLPASAPLRTATTRLEQALVQAPFWVLLRGGGNRGEGGAFSMDDPLTTFSAGGLHHALIHPPAMLLPYYSRSEPRPVDEPMGTLTTRDRYALVGVPDVPDVDDCTFRMFAPLEIAAGMAFAADYQVTGTKRQQVAGYGNAVTPPVAEVIMSAIVEAVTGEALEVAA